MSDDLRLILAIAISFFIFLGWESYLSQHKIHSETALQKHQIKDNSDKSDDINVEPHIVSSNYNVPHEEKFKVIEESPRLFLESDYIKGSIALKGMRFDDLVLKKHKKNVNDEEGISWLLPEGVIGANFIEFGWISLDNCTEVPNKNSVWVADKGKIAPGEKVELSWKNDSGVQFIVSIIMDEKYMFRVERSVRNNSRTEIKLAEFERIVKHKDTGSIRRNYFFHDGVSAIMNGRLFEEDYSKLQKKSKLFENLDFSYNDKKQWFGMSDKYWFISIIPEIANKSNLKFFGKSHSNHVEFIAENSSEMIVQPNQVEKISDYLFIGAKDLRILDEYSAAMNILLFDRTVDFGRLYFITKPIFILLQHLYIVTGNFGVSIMLLTVIVKLLMLPFVNKSYESAHLSKVLQPEIDAIRKKYSFDKQRMNVEILKLFQKHKTSPINGIFPLIIQIPVFFSLYKVLCVTIEMRHAHFFGWVKDLSAPDPVNVFDLFKINEIGLPFNLHLGVWPLIFGLTMFVQQMLLRGNVKKENDIVLMKLLPFMFMFMFSSFPVGLIIYWTWNNMLSSIQQSIVSKRMRKKYG